MYPDSELVFALAPFESLLIRELFPVLGYPVIATFGFLALVFILICLISSLIPFDILAEIITEPDLLYLALSLLRASSETISALMLSLRGVL